MPRYFFDLTDRNVFSPDSVGSELPDLRSAEEEAAKAIVDIARDAMPDGTFRQLAFQARDEQSNHLFEVKVTSNSYATSPVRPDPSRPAVALHLFADRLVLCRSQRRQMGRIGLSELQPELQKFTAIFIADRADQFAPVAARSGELPDKFAQRFGI